jgi:hypothetical protein
MKARHLSATRVLAAIKLPLEVKLEFRFSNKVSDEYAGFYIDDVVVTGK